MAHTFMPSLASKTLYRIGFGKEFASRDLAHWTVNWLLCSVYFFPYMYEVCALSLPLVLNQAATGPVCKSVLKCVIIHNCCYPTIIFVVGSVFPSLCSAPFQK